MNSRDGLLRLLGLTLLVEGGRLRGDILPRTATLLALVLLVLLLLPVRSLLLMLLAIVFALGMIAVAVDLTLGGPMMLPPLVRSSSNLMSVRTFVCAAMASLKV